jgi:hypothetical protein
MGAFDFTPNVGETYVAKMLKPINKIITFPKIASVGTTLHVSNPEHDNNIAIKLGGLNRLSIDTTIYLIGMSRGIICYHRKLDLSQTEIFINKKKFPSGITRFTLFYGKTPLNERAIFIDNKDQLIISIFSHKNIYDKRDSVNLDIEVKDKSGIPVQGSFSLAVTDDSQVKTDTGNYNINTSLLLNAELKGDIEGPGYYINRKDKQAWQALDNLLLTQGWTGHDWKDIFAPAKAVQFAVEKELIISGQVTNLSKRPVPNVPVLLSSQKPNFVITTLTDSSGIYQFKNLPIIDSGSFFIQASNTNGKRLGFGEVNVNRFKPLPVPNNINNQILPWYVNTDSTQINYVRHRAQKEQDDDQEFTGQLLKEVKIKGKRKMENSLTAWGADLAFDEQAIKASAVMTFYEFLKQKLPGIKVIDIHFMPTLIWNGNLIDIYIDGNLKYMPIKMNINPTTDELIEQLNSFNIATFKTIEVVFPAYIPNGSPLKRVYESESAFLSTQWDEYLHYRSMVLSTQPQGITTIYIRTTSGAGWQRNLVPYATTYRPLPIMHPQQFYSPKYNLAQPVGSDTDYRSTLYWKPDILTDVNGKAKVSFYTSDVKGSYTVKIAGIDNIGGIGDNNLKINIR